MEFLTFIGAVLLRVGPRVVYVMNDDAQTCACKCCDKQCYQTGGVYNKEKNKSTVKMDVNNAAFKITFKKMTCLCGSKCIQYVLLDLKDTHSE